MNEKFQNHKKLHSLGLLNVNFGNVCFTTIARHLHNIPNIVKSMISTIDSFTMPS